MHRFDSVTLGVSKSSTPRPYHTWLCSISTNRSMNPLAHSPELAYPSWILPGASRNTLTTLAPHPFLRPPPAQASIDSLTPLSILPACHLGWGPLPPHAPAGGAGKRARLGFSQNTAKFQTTASRPPSHRRAPARASIDSLAPGSIFPACGAGWGPLRRLAPVVWGEKGQNDESWLQGFVVVQAGPGRPNCGG